MSVINNLPPLGNNFIPKKETLKKDSWTEVLSIERLPCEWSENCNVVAYNNRLYYIGYTGSGRSTSGFVGQWTGSNWEPITSGYFAPDVAICYNNKLYIFGETYQGDYSSFNHIEVDGTTISSMYSDDHKLYPGCVVYNNEIYSFSWGNFIKYDGENFTDLGISSPYPHPANAYLIVQNDTLYCVTEVTDAEDNVIEGSHKLYKYDSENNEFVFVTDFPENFTPTQSNTFTKRYGAPFDLFWFIGTKTVTYDYGPQKELFTYYYGESQNEWDSVDVSLFGKNFSNDFTCLEYNEKIILLNAPVYDSEKEQFSLKYCQLEVTSEAPPTWTIVSDMPIEVSNIKSIIYNNNIHFFGHSGQYDEDDNEIKNHYWYEDGNWTNQWLPYGAKQIIKDSNFTILSNAIVGLDPLASSKQKAEANGCSVRALDFEETSEGSIGLTFIADEKPDADIPIDILFN